MRALLEYMHSSLGLRKEKVDVLMLLDPLHSGRVQQEEFSKLPILIKARVSLPCRSPPPTEQRFAR